MQNLAVVVVQGRKRMGFRHTQFSQARPAPVLVLQALYLGDRGYFYSRFCAEFLQ